MEVAHGASIVPPAARASVSHHHIHPIEATDSMNDKQLEALARKNAARTQELAKRRPVYDATLEATRNETSDSAETTRLFKEMKRREF